MEKNTVELRNDWLIAQLERVGWNTGSQEKVIHEIDGDQDHRLVQVPFITAGGNASKARILHGFDHGDEFWIRVIFNLSTVKDALTWLTPKSIQRYYRKNILVVRQGDWFFVKKNHLKPKGIIRKNVLYGSHAIKEWCDGYARGWVTHNTHFSLFLDGWHLPVRCRGWHTLSVPKPVHNQTYWKNRIEHNQKEKTSY